MVADSLCRICLNDNGNIAAMTPLFTDEGKKSTELVRKIEECGGIILKYTAGFPKALCEQCLNLLECSYKFRVLCKDSESALLNVVVKAEISVKSEPKELALNSEDDAPKEEADLIFSLNSDIIEAEEVDLDMLTKSSDDEIYKPDDIHCFEECDVQVLEDTDDPDFVVCNTTPKKKRGKYKKLPKQTEAPVVPRKRGRPKLQTLTLAEQQKEAAKQRKKREDGEDAIMCELCGNIYPKRSLLKMHMRRHMEEKPFECEICCKKFACPSEVRRHMRVHTGEKPYTCKHCGRQFSDRSSNIKHERIHTQERPFVCNTCGKAFTYSNVLKNHMLTHTGEKNFHCEPCGKTFSRKHQLDQHFATLTHQHTVKHIIVVPKDDFSEEVVP